jgi:hypothetical protein
MPSSQLDCTSIDPSKGRFTLTGKLSGRSVTSTES